MFSGVSRRSADFGAASTSASFFFINPATTEIYTLSLHDALPIYELKIARSFMRDFENDQGTRAIVTAVVRRSEEHTSELQSQSNLVCRLLLEKKKARSPSLAALGPARHARSGTRLAPLSTWQAPR